MLWRLKNLYPRSLFYTVCSVGMMNGFEILLRLLVKDLFKEEFNVGPAKL